MTYQRSAICSLCGHAVYTVKIAKGVEPKYRIITLCRCPWVKDVLGKSEKDFPVAR